jgi:hypothetical protein
MQGAEHNASGSQGQGEGASCRGRAQMAGDRLQGAEHNARGRQWTIKWQGQASSWGRAGCKGVGAQCKWHAVDRQVAEQGASGRVRVLVEGAGGECKWQGRDASGCDRVLDAGQGDGAS